MALAAALILGLVSPSPAHDVANEEPAVVSIKRRAFEPVEAVAGYGLILNYDLLADYQGFEDHGTQRATGAFEFRAFSPVGVLRATALGRVNEHSSEFVRRDTTAIFDFPGPMLTVWVGDAITDTPAWGRGVRYGGFRIARDFRLRPDFVPFAAPVFGGEVDAPTTLDLFINDVQRGTAEVPAGAFSLTDLPTPVGANRARVTYVDALGREVEAILPFYANREVLAPGLFQFSLEGGLRRRSYNVESFDYDTPMVMGTARYGVSRWLTAETHAELTETLTLTGIGAAVTVSDLAAASFTAAHSSSDDGSGQLIRASIERVAPRHSLRAQVIRTFGDYRDVLALDGPLHPRQEIQASGNVLWQGVGNFGLAYIERDFWAPDRAPLRLLSPSYATRRFSPFVFRATGNWQIERDEWAVGLTLTVPFGGGFSAGSTTDIRSAHVATSAYGQYRPPGPDPGFGWRALAGTNGGDSGPHLEGRLFYDGPYGDGAVTGSVRDQAHGVRAEYNGGLVLMDGDLFATDRVENAFVLVDVDGTPGVDVRRGNRPLGQTGPRGHVLAEGFRGYERGRFAIAPESLPADRAAEVQAIDVRPRRFSGALVSFPLASGKAAEPEEEEAVEAVVVEDEIAEETPTNVAAAAAGPFTVTVRNSRTSCELTLTYTADAQGLVMPRQIICP